MADAEQLALIRRSVEEWNAWRKRNPGVGADLSGANLNNAFLAEADLSGAYLSNAFLVEADLRGADFSGAEIHGADLRRAVLVRAHLHRVMLSNADLRISGTYS